jgi:hypothetical protein
MRRYIVFGDSLDLDKVGTIPMLQDLSYSFTNSTISPDFPIPRKSSADQPCAEEIACRGSRGRRRGATLAKTIGVGIACAALCEFRKPRCPGSDWHQLLDGRRRQCSGYTAVGVGNIGWNPSHIPCRFFPAILGRRIVFPSEKERGREASIAKCIQVRP